MPKRKSPSQRKLSTEDFFDKYADLLRQLRTPVDGRPSPINEYTGAGAWVPFQLAIHHLNAAGFTPLLKTAQRESNSEAFKEILQILIQSLGVEAPKGVFTPKPKTGKPGRRISAEGAQIFSKWEKIGEPSPYGNALAQAYYGASFTNANGIDRRRMRDKCRNAIDRYLDREIAHLNNRRHQLEKELAEQEKELTELKKKLGEQGTGGLR